MTDFVPSIVTVQVGAVPLQAPPQPAKTRLARARAVSVTTAPRVNAPLQAVPQLMPAGLLVTVPFALSLPVLVTVSVKVDGGGGGGGGAAVPRRTMLPTDGTPPASAR